MGISSTSFKPGKSGGPGRPKGSPNKFKLTAVRDFFSTREIDPIERIWDLITKIKDPSTKASLMLRLLPWIEPRTRLDHIPLEDQTNKTGLENVPTEELLRILCVTKPVNGSRPS